MKVSEQKSAYATAYTAIDAQGLPPIPGDEMWEKRKDVLTGEKEVKDRWKEYFEELLNIENERDDMEESGLVYGPVEEFSVAEVKNAVENLKNGKAAGPTGITAEH